MALYAPIRGVLNPDDTQDPDAALRAHFDQIINNNGQMYNTNVPNPNDSASNFPVSTTPDAPADTIDPSSVPMASPEAPHRGGFFQRMVDKPGGRQALLAFGQSMLTSPDFFSGLGNGGVAYQKAFDDEAVKSRPQLTKDQEFSYKFNPQTGEYDFDQTAAGALHLKTALGKLQTTSDDKRYGIEQGLAGRLGAARIVAGTANNKLEHQDRWNTADNDTRVKVAHILGNSGIERARLTAELRGAKPVAGSVLGQYTEAAQKASAADITLDWAGRVLDDIENDRLDLGLVTNLRANVSQKTGWGSNEKTRALSNWAQFQEVLANAILRDAKGVQTEPDAVRAHIQNLISSGDTEGAKAEMANAMRLIENGRNFNLAKAMDISSQYNIKTDNVDAVSHPNHPSPSRRVAPTAPPAPTARPTSGTTSGVKWRIKPQ
jgi:hypothetical protein